MTDATAGWKPDPTARHDHRYFDGTKWTEHVSDAGVAATDPYDGPATPAAETGTPATPGTPSPTTADPAGSTASSSPAAGSSSSTSEPVTPDSTPGSTEPAASTPSEGFTTSPLPAPSGSGATGSTLGGSSSSPSTRTSAPSSTDEPESTFRMTEAGTEAPDDASSDTPAEPAAPTPAADEPTSTFRMTEEGVGLDVPGAEPEGVASGPTIDDDLSLTGVLSSAGDTDVLSASPPPPTVTAPTGDGGSKRKLFIGVGIAAIIAIVAGIFLLGGDDDDSDGSLKERIAEQIREGGQSGLSEDEAECLAEDLIDDIGAARLEGVDFADPPPELAGALTDALAKAIPACDVILGDANDRSDAADASDGPTTDATLSGDQLTQFRELLTEQWVRDLGVSEEDARCMANLTADAIQSNELSRSQSNSAFFEYLDACGISLSELGGAASSGAG